MSTRRFAAPAVALTLAFTLAACGDDESATDRACDARSDLRSAIEAVGEDLAAANLGDARDSLTEVGDALGELSDALSDVADEQAEELRPEADAVRASVEGLADVSSLDELSAQFEEIRTGIAGLVTSVADAFSCD